MPFALLDGPRWFVRQELLGSEAVYEILEVGDEVATAEVVCAPGLPRGERVQLLASSARAMERSDLAEPIAASRRDAPSRASSRRASVAG